MQNYDNILNIQSQSTAREQSQNLRYAKSNCGYVSRDSSKSNLQYSQQPSQQQVFSYQTSSNNTMASSQNQFSANQSYHQNHQKHQQYNNQVKDSKNFSTTDLHQAGVNSARVTHQNSHVNRNQNMMKKLQTQSPQVQLNNQNQLMSMNNNVLQEQSMNNVHNKNDNIQKAIDNLKHFIKGNFPKNALQQNSKLIQSKNNVQNQKQSSRPQMSMSNMLNQNKQREMSEDPKLLLASSFFNRQQIQQMKTSNQTEEDETDAEEGKRKNPHEPIPAFTSIEIAKKLRYRSEDRYINDRMERELKAYQVEIEKRFGKSQLKDFAFPRVQTQTPLFFSTMAEIQQERTVEENQNERTRKHKQNKMLSIGSNKENIDSDISDFRMDLNQLSSPQSPYGYKAQETSEKLQGANYTINDYKRILQQFLSSGLQSAELTPSQSQQPTFMGQQNQKQLNQIQHQRSQSSRMQQSSQMVSQKVLANAKQAMHEHQNKQKYIQSHKHTNHSNNNGKHLSTMTDQSLTKIHREESEDRDFDTSEHHYDSSRPHFTEGAENDYFVSGNFNENFNGLVESYQTSGLTSSHLKTFDYSNKVVNNKNNILTGYLTNGLNHKQVSSHSRKNTNDGTQKPRKSKEGISLMVDQKISGPKASSKAQDYFKTFYNKPGTNQVKSNDKAIRQPTQSNHSNIVFNQNNEQQNPFVTLSQPNTQSLISSTASNNQPGKSHQSNKSISGKISQPQIISSQIAPNPFQMQVNLKTFAQDNNLKVQTRNNKLTTGSGMHVRAKTTSDFDTCQTATTSKLKSIAVNQDNNQQYRQSEILQMSTNNNGLMSYNLQTIDNTKTSFINASKQQKIPNMQHQNQKRKEARSKANETTKTQANNNSNTRTTVVDDNLNKHVKSLKFSKNSQLIDSRSQYSQIHSTINNGLCTDRQVNPYNQQMKQSQNYQQMLYSHREPTKQIQQRENSHNSIDNKNSNSTTRVNCPYSDARNQHKNMNPRSLLSSQVTSTTASSTQNNYHHGYSSSMFDGNHGASKNNNMKHIYASFQNQVNSAKTSVRKKNKLDAQQQLALARSNSKRDFKVKCMKIDLSKQLEYCTTESSQ
ncbi:UNKNOWN [Stylonychia lemnae]|uniref:Uncharacterized protein n=1 Tax=Stylonychia lemnae TaxID=5949 RepID=A0A078BDZ8_STYLE|nr:UNKNOWN [Stylonychia lemnae]|eukprot:CDW91808.1 UNKNOWN [Stylonychia lemnae]